MRLQFYHSEILGSLTPQLEGAPHSQMHDQRVHGPAAGGPMLASAEEKGQIDEATADPKG